MARWPQPALSYRTSLSSARQRVNKARNERINNDLDRTTGGMRKEHNARCKRPRGERTKVNNKIKRVPGREVDSEPET